jgi:hypothetical protein
MLRRLDRLDSAVADLRSFVDEFDFAPPPDVQPPPALEPENHSTTLKRCLFLLSDFINLQRTFYTIDTRRFAVTRKKFDAKAGQNSAIGWLAIGMRRITGRPYTQAVADLAQVILPRTEISQDRVSSCARAYNRQRHQKTAHSAPKKGPNAP